MPRDFSNRFRRSLEVQRSEDVLLVFATITHPDLVTPIMVVADTVDYIYNGETYIGFPFELELLSDSDAPPTGKIIIQNVDRRIGEAVQNLRSSPRLKLEILSSADFDLDQNPRVALSTPTVEYIADFLRLSNISVNVMQLEATIESWNFSQEPWPNVRATQDRFPGLFR